MSQGRACTARDTGQNGVKLVGGKLVRVTGVQTENHRESLKFWERKGLWRWRGWAVMCNLQICLNLQISSWRSLEGGGKLFNVLCRAVLEDLKLIIQLTNIFFKKVYRIFLCVLHGLSLWHWAFEWACTGDVKYSTCPAQEFILGLCWVKWDKQDVKSQLKFKIFLYSQSWVDRH